MTHDLDKTAVVLHKGQACEVRQTAEFDQWLIGLRDRKGRSLIFDRLRRLSDGHFGDTKSVGNGAHALRMFCGPGYRLYYVRQGDVVILLLNSGDKDGQFCDIAKAKALAKELNDATGDYAG
jgi:putative addiction module killer protein